jgi:hypothetical protein
MLLNDRVTGAYTCIGMNCRQPPPDEVSVRQAVALALDRQVYSDRAFLGHGEIINGGPIPGFCWAHCDLHSFAEPDTNRARRLPASTRHTNGLAFTLTTIADYPDLLTAATVAQKNLAKIGVIVDIQSMDTAASWTRWSGGMNSSCWPSAGASCVSPTITFMLSSIPAKPGITRVHESQGRRHVGPRPRGAVSGRARLALSGDSEGRGRRRALCLPGTPDVARGTGATYRASYPWPTGRACHSWRLGLTSEMSGLMTRRPDAGP